MSQKYTAPSYDKEYEPGEYPDLPPPVNNQGVWGGFVTTFSRIGKTRY